MVIVNALVSIVPKALAVPSLPALSLILASTE